LRERVRRKRRFLREWFSREEARRSEWHKHKEDRREEIRQAPTAGAVMSTRPDSFSDEDAFSIDAAKQAAPKQNGRPGPADELTRETESNADFRVTSHGSDGDEPESPRPARYIAQPAIAEIVSESPPQSTPQLALPPASLEEPLFEGYEFIPPPPPPRRKPDLADVLLFALLATGGFVCSILLMVAAVHHHIFGVTAIKQANDEIHYRIGSQVAWYLFTLLFCTAVFPFAWRRSFFAGLQWQAGAAADRIWRLMAAALACFVAAIVDELVMPGPANTPIDQTFRMPGAVWLLFGFGVTLAPLIEEIAYRGLLLPALCTAYDWTTEQFTHSPPRPLAGDGFPRWSTSAMVFGSVVVSVPFALMHGEQTAYSIGPFLLLVCISLVLCCVRLAVRSLAASVVVHSSYNLLLFSMMFLGTGGFKHLDKM
jgi:membrane protease YdiL (CAAX protease family)